MRTRRAIHDVCSWAFRCEIPSKLRSLKNGRLCRGEFEIKKAHSRNFPPPEGVEVTSLGCRSFARDAQSLHRAHDRDPAPGIAAAWRRDVAVGQLHRDFAKWPVPHRFQDRAPTAGATIGLPALKIAKQLKGVPRRLSPLGGWPDITRSDSTASKILVHGGSAVPDPLHVPVTSTWSSARWLVDLDQRFACRHPRDIPN